MSTSDPEADADPDRELDTDSERERAVFFAAAFFLAADAAPPAREVRLPLTGAFFFGAGAGADAERDELELAEAEREDDGERAATFLAAPPRRPRFAGALRTGIDSDPDAEPDAEADPELDAESDSLAEADPDAEEERDEEAEAAVRRPRAMMEKSHEKLVIVTERLSFRFLWDSSIRFPFLSKSPKCGSKSSIFKICNVRKIWSTESKKLEFDVNNRIIQRPYSIAIRSHVVCFILWRYDSRGQ